MKHVSRARRATLQAELRKTGELYGPVSDPMDCPVTVEYEGEAISNDQLIC